MMGSGVGFVCVALWLFAESIPHPTPTPPPLFHVLFCSVSYCCIYWILSSIVITLLGKRELVTLYGLWFVLGGGDSGVCVMVVGVRGGGVYGFANYTAL